MSGVELRDAEIGETGEHGKIFTDIAKENFKGALAENLGEKSLEEALTVFQPEIDTLTLPDDWGYMSDQEKADAIESKIQSYDQAVTERKARIPEMDPALAGFAKKIATRSQNADLTNIGDDGFIINPFARAARCLLNLQSYTEKGIPGPVSLTVYSGRGGKFEQTNQYTHIEKNHADWESAAFQTLFGIDANNKIVGEPETLPQFNSSRADTVQTTTYQTKIPGLTLKDTFRNPGDPKNEGRLVSLAYE